MQGGLTAAVTPFLKKKGWDRQSLELRHVVAAHALRGQHDRCAARPRPHALSPGRPPRRVPGPGPLRHRAHPGRGANGSSRRSSELKPFPDVIAALEPAQDALQARHPLERRPRHARSGAAPYRLCLRPHHLGAGGRLFQAALRDLRRRRRQIINAEWPRDRAIEHRVRRQPRLRLHRRQGAWLPHRLRRPPQAAVRPIAASARSDRRRLRRTRRDAAPPS